MAVWWLSVVDMTPDPGGLPGKDVIQRLTNGLGFWAEAVALAALVVGAALWAIGAHSQNFQQSLVGRRAVLLAGVAALLIGAAPTLINTFFDLGRQVH